MPRPHYPVLLDGQLLSIRLGSIKQAHVEEFNAPACASLPVEDVIIGYGVALKIKVHLLAGNVKCHFLEVVLELENQYILLNTSDRIFSAITVRKLKYTCHGCMLLL